MLQEVFFCLRCGLNECLEEVEKLHFRLTRKKTMKQFESEYMSGDGNDKKIPLSDKRDFFDYFET